MRFVSYMSSGDIWPFEMIQLTKIRVFGHDDVIVLVGILPYRPVQRCAKLQGRHMRRAGVQVGQVVHKQRRKILIKEQQFHSCTASMNRSR
jgi:hypothetical protein